MQNNFTEFEQAVDKAARDGFSNSHLWAAHRVYSQQFMKCVYEVYWANYFNTATEVN